MTPSFVSAFKKFEEVIYKRTGEIGTLLGCWSSIISCNACHKPADNTDHKSTCCNAKVVTTYTPGVWNIYFPLDEETRPIHEHHLAKIERRKNG